MNNPRIALRPYLPADAGALIDIFRDSIEVLAAEDYDDDQRAAWAAAADDEKAFAARLSSMLTILAVIDGEPVGFAALREPDVLDLLYVDPAAARQGVASALCDAIEKLAQARGASQILTDASDTARPFFEQRGYAAQTRQTVERNGEYLANTVMKKVFPGSAQNDNAAPPNPRTLQ